MVSKSLSILRRLALISLLAASPLVQAGGFSIHFGHGFVGHGFGGHFGPGFHHPHRFGLHGHFGPRFHRPFHGFQGFGHPFPSFHIHGLHDFVDQHGHQLIIIGPDPRFDGRQVDIDLGVRFVDPRFVDPRFIDP